VLFLLKHSYRRSCDQSGFAADAHAFEWKTSDWIIQEIGLAIGLGLPVIIRLDGHNATILTAYGAYGFSQEPTIDPALAYDKLGEIQEGSAAMNAYLELIDPGTENTRRQELRDGLRRYCAHDTMAMVKLVEVGTLMPPNSSAVARAKHDE